MKKFVVFLILAAVVAAGWYFYDPYIKDQFAALKAKYGETADSRESETIAPDGSVPDQPSSANPKASGTPSAPKTASTGSSISTGSSTPKHAQASGTPTPTPAVEGAPLSEIDKLLQQKYPLPNVIPLMTIVDNWNNVPQNAFPGEVALKVAVPFEIPGVGSSSLAPGTTVRPAYLSGDTLTVASLNNLANRMQVAVDSTDFKERIQKRYDDLVANANAKVRAQREKARAVLESRPEAVVAASTTAWDSADDPRFVPVKASLDRNELPSVKPDEATAFRWGGRQIIRGDEIKGSYDTVVVSFDVQTIFGVFPTEWMAVLNNGQVLGWVDPITHESTAMN